MKHVSSSWRSAITSRVAKVNPKHCRPKGTSSGAWALKYVLGYELGRKGEPVQETVDALDAMMVEAMGRDDAGGRGDLGRRHPGSVLVPRPFTRSV